MLPRPWFGFILSLTLMLPTAPAGEAPTETQRLYLSGRGPDEAVLWDFTVSDGRRAGEAATIPVPSHWELHGFGTYNYGQEVSKSEERGFYRTRFVLPAEWEGRRIRLVFGGSMTDTTARVNGRLVGPTHQGGFNQFQYDITPHVRFAQENVLEVEVAKVSADPDTERAERGGDYWVFGGIYRPVWIESLPARHIEHVALDAVADGRFRADVVLNSLREATRPLGPELQPERLEAQIFDADGQAVGEKFGTRIPAGGAGRLWLETRVDQPLPWSAETPHLYTVRVARLRGEDVLHTVTVRFGFRTFEIREGDGLYVNGRRVLLKGVNRHSFRPATGRALTREQNYEDVRLIQAMNMNAVRMSHYAPDPAFLEACDELGLYVLNELSGWQWAHATPNGRRLVRSLVERDVNHPSVIIWNNGNEGGWNRDLDGDFALYDPQRRPVLHPWDPFGGIDTRHYTDFNLHAWRLQGPNLVMPLEILHALYDGGAGAGLHDYWRAIVESPFGAGAFIWVLADEGLVRTDQNGRIDVFSTFGPDGIVGPQHEKEGSYYTVREIWSPVQLDPPDWKGGFDGRLRVHNHYNFTSLATCQFEWQWLRFDGERKVMASGRLAGPAVAPGASGDLRLPLPDGWRDADALAVTVKDHRGHELWTWTWATPLLDQRNAVGVAKVAAPVPTLDRDGDHWVMRTGDRQVRIDTRTGRLVRLQRGASAFALSDGPRLVYARPEAGHEVVWLPTRESPEAASEVRTLAAPQVASMIEVELETTREIAYSGFALELSPDGKAWHTIYDGTRRAGDGSRYVFPPQTVAAARLRNVRHFDASPAQVKLFRIGHAPTRYPSEPDAVTVNSGRAGGVSPTVWVEVEEQGENATRFRWTLDGQGALRLEYRYRLTGEFYYHGVTFAHPEQQLEGWRWLGEGPYRVWQNRLHGTWLDIHANQRQVLQPGESFDYPEFEGMFAGVRWAELTTTAGTLRLRSLQPDAYLRLGTPRISHPQTTVDFPSGDVSFLHAIPGIGSKFKTPQVSGPSAQPARADGEFAGTVFLHW
jgi:hypothetical protein